MSLLARPWMIHYSHNAPGSTAHVAHDAALAQGTYPTRFNMFEKRIIGMTAKPVMRALCFERTDARFAADNTSNTTREFIHD
jgi:hypothetical protein